MKNIIIIKIKIKDSQNWAKHILMFSSKINRQWDVFKSAHGWRCFSFKPSVKKGVALLFPVHMFLLILFLSVVSSSRRAADVERPLPPLWKRKDMSRVFVILSLSFKLFTSQHLIIVYLWEHCYNLSYTHFITDYITDSTALSAWLH